MTNVGCMNVEVTVQKQRGWVDEANKTMAADMMVQGTIWFSPSAHQNWFVRRAWDHFADNGLPFPHDKAHAIKVTTHAERWRHSIDVDHGWAPNGSVASVPRYADHTEFEPYDHPIEDLEELLKIIEGM